MPAQRLSVKFFVQGDLPFDLDALIPIFHKWIQQHTLEGLSIDIADYKHVHQGPGVLLIGHEGDTSFDLRGGRPGLLYTRKRVLSGDLAADIAEAVRLARTAVDHLSVEPTLNGAQFDTQAFEVMILDRLALPNTPESFETVLAAIVAAVPGAAIESVERDARKPLTARVSV
ncbi:MAG: hypothetical protein SGJ24_11235 [Chloroflexota bacterium]|nr:hypothetical protein [Chloroflexota bacterium]